MFRARRLGPRVPIRQCKFGYISEFILLNKKNEISQNGKTETRERN